MDCRIFLNRVFKVLVSDETCSIVVHKHVDWAEISDLIFKVCNAIFRDVFVSSTDERSDFVIAR